LRVALDELVGDRVEVFAGVVRLRADVERALPSRRISPACQPAD
jgi:hypothetical protein